MSAEKKRAVISVLDVGFGSGTTLVVSIIAARALEVEAFGIFGILFALTTAVQSVVQGGYIDVLLRGGSNVTRSTWPADRFLPIAVILGFIPVCAEVYLRFDSLVLPLISFIGCAFLFIRYSWVRAFYYSQGRSAASLRSSCCLFVIASVFLAISFFVDYGSWAIVVVATVAAYGLSGLAAYVESYRTSKVSPMGDESIWRWDYAVESALLAGSMQMSSVVITPALGLQFSAGYRGGAMLFGPLSMIFSAVRLLLLPKFAGKDRSLRVLVSSCLAVIFVVFTWSVLVFYGVVVFGSSLLGDSAQLAQSLVGWFALSYASQGVYLVFFLAGRAWLLDTPIRWGRIFQLVSLAVGVFVSILLEAPAPYFLGTIIGNVLAGTFLIYSIYRK